MKLPKGTRDVFQEQKIAKDSVTDTIKQTFELYGFSPLETPIIETYETLSSKYSGGSEILKETFKLKDQGERELGLRYDLTVPLARFIAMNPQIKLPFKCYQLGSVFRDGPISSNRLRQFTQCDADVIGIKSLTAEAELLSLAEDVFKKLKIKITIKVNNRKILDSILQELKVKEEDRNTAILTIDKLDKLTEEDVKKELKEKSIPVKFLEIIKQPLSKLKLSDKEGLNELKELLKLCKSFGIKDVKPDLSLARGLNYYTGTVFEVFTKGTKEAIAGGGRYDKMIGNFVGQGDYPAVGISFGIDRLTNLLKTDKKTPAQLYIIPIKTFTESIKIAKQLREQGIKVDIDLNDKGISRNLDYADKLNIPYVIFIGNKEIKAKKLKLRNMKTGKEKLVTIKNIKNYLE